MNTNEIFNSLFGNVSFELSEEQKQQRKELRQIQKQNSLDAILQVMDLSEYDYQKKLLKNGVNLDKINFSKKEINKEATKNNTSIQFFFRNWAFEQGFRGVVCNTHKTNSKINILMLTGRLMETPRDRKNIEKKFLAHYNRFAKNYVHLKLIEFRVLPNSVCAIFDTKI